MRYLCLDTGGTSVKYAICDENGCMEHRGQMEVGATVEEFLNHVKSLWEQIEQKDSFVGIACSFPGEVCSEDGIIKGISAVTQLHNYPLKAAISSCCGFLPVTMLNDANAAALGEQWLGVGRDYQNAAFVIVGSGVGGAVIEKGSLYVGTTRNKAEIGNFIMGKAQNGSLLTWSDFTLEKQARRYSGVCGKRIHGKELLMQSRNGDLFASALVDEFLYYMAVGCINVQFAYDPEIIAIGGGLSEDQELIRAIGDRYCELTKGHRVSYLMPRIVACEKGNSANLLGALRYFKEQVCHEI